MSMAMAGSARAAVLVEYGFGTDSASATYQPTSSSAGVTGSAITAASGFTGLVSGNARSGISTTSGNPINCLFTRGTDDTDEASAVANSKYFSLTLTPGSGQTIDLSSLTFDYRRDASSSASTGILRTDAGGDGFTTDVGGSFSMTGTSTSTFTTGPTLDLSGVASLQNVTLPVTFRIYIFGGTKDTAVTRYDNIAFNGTVPEPTTAGVLCLAGMGLTLARRRRG
jgi:hypothetical protein